MRDWLWASHAIRRSGDRREAVRRRHWRTRQPVERGSFRPCCQGTSMSHASHRTQPTSPPPSPAQVAEPSQRPQQAAPSSIRGVRVRESTSRPITIPESLAGQGRGQLMSRVPGSHTCPRGPSVWKPRQSFEASPRRTRQARRACRQFHPWAQPRRWSRRRYRLRNARAHPRPWLVQPPRSRRQTVQAGRARPRAVPSWRRLSKRQRHRAALRTPQRRL